MDQAQNLRNIIKAKSISEKVSESNARIVTVTSGKGGVGKSSISVNLAIQLRKLGYNIIIFDADFGLANIEVLFGVIPKYNLTDLIYRGKSLEDIIVKGPMDIGFISGGSGTTGLANLSNDHLELLTRKLVELGTLADIIIIDTGAGISNTVLEFVTSCREVLLVTTPEPTSITDSYALLKALNQHPCYDKENTVIKLIANRVVSEQEAKNMFEKLSIVAKKFLNIDIKSLGVIPMDSHVTKAVMRQKPVSLIYENSAASKAFAELAKKFVEEDLNSFPEKEGIAKMMISLLKLKLSK